MEKIIRNIFFVSIGCLLLASCAAAPYVTSEVIERKYENLVLGQSRATALEVFGVPHYTISIPKGKDTIEIAGYELGNYSYSEQILLFFKNGRFIGAPRNYQQIFRLMHALQIFEGAYFWNLPNEEAMAA